MFQTLKNAWKIPELKNRILFTLMIVILYRLGSNLPMPWVNPAMFESYFNASGNALTWLNMLSGGALAQATLFALSVSPYITASIVIQLLTIAIPKFEEWAKEGEAGKKKLSAITRVLTVVLALVTAIGYTMFMNSQGMLTFTSNKEWSGFEKGMAYVVLVLAYCAGASVIMWLAEKINEKGIGNGISIILFANIIARLPAMAGNIWRRCFTRWDIFVEKKVENWKAIQIPAGIVCLLLFLAILLIAVIAVVWFSNSERRIPVQYAKRVVGRKMYGGQSTHLPIKVNASGVMPIIFAASIMSLPATIEMMVTPKEGGIASFIFKLFSPDNAFYIILYVLLIFMFSYFYAAIQFNPVEIANNLKKNGGFIPGFRPGRPTSDFITKALGKVTFLGAIFLSIVAGVPLIVGALNSSMSSIALGGTSVLIVVGVALETVRQLESQLMMRNYKGFLE